MATEVGTAYVTLLPSMRGFSRAATAEIGASGIEGAITAAATRGATAGGSKAGGLFSRAFNREALKQSTGGVYVAGLLRNLRTYGYAIAGVTGLTVGLGLKTASAMQQAKIAFDTILGSAKRAHDLFASLVQFAKVTPFNLPGIVTASQQLLAYGFAAKQVLPVLHSLGDASAGLSLGTDGLQRVVVALGQIKAKGRLQSQELLQLTENGIPALAILANKFHVTQAALLDFVQKGLVPAKKAIPALLSGLETGTNGLAGKTAKFGGLMRKQSKTLGGVFSNLKDSLSIGLARAVKPLIPVLQKAIPGAAKALSRAMKQGSHDLAEFLHGLGVAKDRSKGTTTTFESIGGALRALVGALRTGFNFVRKFSTVFKGLGAELLGAYAAIKLVTLGTTLLNAVVEANPFVRLITIIGALIGYFVYLYHANEKFRAVVQAVWHGIVRVIGFAVSTIVSLFKVWVDVWFTVVGSMVHGAAKAFGWIPGIGGKLKGAARAFDGFRSDVDGTLSRIASDAAGWGDTAGTNWRTHFESRATLFGEAAKFFLKGSGLKGWLANGGLDRALGQDKGAATTAGTDIGNSVAAGLDKSGSKVSKSASSLVDKILGPLKDLRSKAAQLASSIAQAITGDTGFGAILNMTDSLGAAFGVSLHSITFGLQAQLHDILHFRRELKAEQKRGLSSSAAQEIASEGLTNGSRIADALAGATRKQLRQISSFDARTNKAALTIGRDFAAEKYGSRIARELAQTHKAIEHAAKSTNLSDKTIHRLEAAYKAAAKAAQPYVKTTELDHKHGKKVRQH